MMRVCATPESGFWTVDGSTTPLRERITEHGGNYSVPCSKIGQDPEVPWADDEVRCFTLFVFWKMSQGYEVLLLEPPPIHGVVSVISAAMFPMFYRHR